MNKKERRIMHAASRVEPVDCREAAILGGVVRSLMDKGQVAMQYAQHASVALMTMPPLSTVPDAMFPGIGPAVNLLPDVSMPSEGEVVAMAHKLQAEYRNT